MVSKINFHILTIFPKIFDSYFNEALLKKALKAGLIKINTVNIRDFSRDKHKKVDDRPFGGGPGMVLQVEPIYRAIQSLKPRIDRQPLRTILLSPRGKKLDSKSAKRLSKYHNLILICGRYEGVDERVAKHLIDEEVSIGDYILSGGELAAMVLVEAISRHIPGFLGKQESLEEIKGSYPVYTRPEIFTAKNKLKWSVPKILLSGNQKKIKEWRDEQPN